MKYNNKNVSPQLEKKLYIQKETQMFKDSIKTTWTSWNNHPGNKDRCTVN